ncbi:MAG: hypothetical protein NTZ50_13785 [Chloroflexi bacterium]|nr:hypothetical protein [Chloroflexota bacterium]
MTTSHTTSVWRSNSLHRTIYSTLGCELNLPLHWIIHVDGRRIMAEPPQSSTDAAHLSAPAYEFASRTLQRNSADQLERTCAEILQREHARSIRRHLINHPRTGLLFEAISAPAKAPPLFICLLAETTDDEETCILHLFRDRLDDAAYVRAHAHRIWRKAQPHPAPLLSTHRRWVSESAGIQIGWPKTWLVDADSADQLTVRPRRRSRSRPSLLVKIDTSDERARSLTELAARIGWTTHFWQPTRIGNRAGLCTDTNFDGTSFVRFLLPEPTTHAAVFAQISLAPHESPLADALQSDFHWSSID